MSISLKISLKARALRYLSQREHSRQELAHKLARYAQQEGDAEKIEALLETLETDGWLSELRFSEALARRRSARFGNSRIVAELQSQGIEGELINKIKSELNQSEAERACEVWRKKFATPPANADERAKQIRFLLQRGFSLPLIQSILRAAMHEIAVKEKAGHT